jgi:hypothetical protein
MTPELKAEIDKLNVCQLLSAQRFSPIGDPRFKGEEGEYRMKRLFEVLEHEGNDAFVSASKSLGWER